FVEEGIELRSAGTTGNILVFVPADEHALKACAQWQLTPVISSPQSLRALANVASANQPMAVHVKYNVGMNRLGFDLSDAADVEAQISQIPGVELQGVCCHLPNSDDVVDPNGITLPQLE